MKEIFIDGIKIFLYCIIIGGFLSKISKKVGSRIGFSNLFIKLIYRKKN